MTKKILMCTWCTDDYYDFLGVDKLINSIKYFHPEVDYIIFDQKMVEDVYSKYPWMNYAWMIPETCLPFVDEYDMIVHVDGDSTITGSLDELFNSQADLISVRNHNSFNLASAWKPPEMPHFPPYGNGQFIENQKYINTGFIASNNKDFWYEWHELNERYATSNQSKEQILENVYQGCYDEQQTANQIFHSGKYTTEILDPKGSKLSYGISNSWGPQIDPWRSWLQLYMKNGKLCLVDPVEEQEMCVKVLHQAGSQVGYKLNSTFGGLRNWMRSFLSKEVIEYLNEVTNG